MRIFFITCVLAVLMVACSGKDKFPKDVLPEKQMRELMWDMIRTGEFLNGFVANKDSSVSKTPEIEKWFSKVYQLHKTNKAQFDKSLAYYKNHPALMKNILDTLAKRQVYTRPVIRDSSALKDSGNRRPGPFPRADTSRRSFDSLRKKMIKRKKNLLNAP